MAMIKCKDGGGNTEEFPRIISGTFQRTVLL